MLLEERPKITVAQGRQIGKRRRIMVEIIRRDEFVHRIQISFVDLLVKPAHEGLVRCGGHDASPFV